MELFIFARFHARPDQEGAVAEALRDVLGPSRQEAGCVSIHAFRSISDAQLFYIHSRWKDEAAFDYHASLPHTVHFIDRVEPLIDHPLDVTRAELIDGNQVRVHVDILAAATASFLLQTLKLVPASTRSLLPLQLDASPVGSPRRTRIFDVANPNRSTLLCFKSPRFCRSQMIILEGPEQ